MSPAFRTLAVLAATTTLALIGTATTAQAEPELASRCTTGPKTISSTPVILTEQKSDRLVVMDLCQSWDKSTAQLWSWKASKEFGITDPETSWGLPDDARLRRDADGNRFVLATDSYGLLAKIPYPAGGEVAWSVELGRGPNPHGIELLPNGNIAVAASTGKFVRVYAASQGQHADHYVEDVLPGAHEVYWDEPTGSLWAIGDTELIEYEVGGIDAEPTLTRKAVYRLPTNWGHDLQPVTGDPDRFWVTTVYGVHQFVKSTRKFDHSFPRTAELYALNIKSIGTDAETGVILQTTPKKGNPCSWCTDQVDFFIGADRNATRILPGAEIYRARWFDERAN
ncbi:DUF6528 family protein [Microlunatus sp. GCM10028923]|uniref:DUF6528 family protein n=1 Tax=Microlunatus sp. GCM10028923 TaxID=3273400 RepID=UPI0036080D2C